MREDRCGREVKTDDTTMRKELLEQCSWKRNSGELNPNSSINNYFILTTGKGDYVGKNAGTSVILVVGPQGISY